MSAADVIELIRQRTIDLRSRLCRCFAEEIRPALAEHGIRIISLDDANARGARGGRAPLHQPGLPGAHPAGDRARPALPLHLQPVPELGVLLRNPEKEEEVAARVKVPKELLRRFLSIGDWPHLRAPRGRDRGQPRRPLPGHGDRPSLAVPGHARHRLRRLRRGRRPAARSRGGGAPPPLRGGRAARGRAGDGAEAPRPARRGDGDRAAAGLRDPGAARARRSHRRLLDSGVPRAPLSVLAGCHARRSSSRGAGRTARSTSSPRCARATSSCTIPTTPSPARSSASSGRPSRTRTSSRSSRPSTGPAPTRRSYRA